MQSTRKIMGIKQLLLFYKTELHCYDSQEFPSSSFLVLQKIVHVAIVAASNMNNKGCPNPTFSNCDTKPLSWLWGVCL